MKHTHVTLQYFKESGKYYSEGEHAIPYEDDAPVPFYRCLEIIRGMLERGERPGLVDGYGFNTLVTIYSEYGPLPCLFMRGMDSNDRPFSHAWMQQFADQLQDHLKAGRTNAAYRMFRRIGMTGEPDERDQ